MNDLISKEHEHAIFTISIIDPLDVATYQHIEEKECDSHEKLLHRFICQMDLEVLSINLEEADLVD